MTLKLLTLSLVGFYSFSLSNIDNFFLVLQFSVALSGTKSFVINRSLFTVLMSMKLVRVTEFPLRVVFFNYRLHQQQFSKEKHLFLLFAICINKFA